MCIKSINNKLHSLFFRLSRLGLKNPLKIGASAAYMSIHFSFSEA